MSEGETEMKTVKVTAEIPAPPEGYGEPEWGRPQKGCVWYGGAGRCPHGWEKATRDWDNDELWVARPKPKVERWVVLWRDKNGDVWTQPYSNKALLDEAMKHPLGGAAILGITHVVEGRFDLPLQEDEA